MQRWRHICTNRPPPDHLRATYAQPARRCAPSHARPAMMNVIHVSQRCQRLVGNYVSAGRGFRWHLLGTNPPRTPGPQRETAASFGASAPDRRGLFRPSTQPTGPRPFRADTVTPLTPASTLPQVTGFRYAALAPYLHEPPTAGPIRAAYGQPGPPRPGTVDEITIDGPDRDVVGDAVEAPSTRSRFTAQITISSASQLGTVDEITIRGLDHDLVGVVGSVGGAGGMSRGSPTRLAWETSARTPASHARRASRGTRCR